MRELSLGQHLQQDDSPEEDAAMRSSIMHRFLRAAKEVAAEHESSIFPPKRNNHSKSTFPQQSQRTSTTHRTKSRAQQAPKGFVNSHPSHSWHQEDSMPHSKSGFFCLGLKTALSRAHRTVDSASGQSTSRKKSWAPHPPTNHMKVANEGEGSVARKRNSMERMSKYQSAINTDVPVLYPLSPESANVKGSCQRRAIKYPASFSRRGYLGSDGCTNVGCNPALSQSAKANLAGNQFENMKPKQIPDHDEQVWVRKFVSAALKEQEIETVQECVTTCDQTRTCDCKSTCVCHHVKNLPPHDLAGEISMSSNSFQDDMNGLETIGGKSVHEDGDHYEDDKPQFCDASSTLNSVKSDTTFYTFGSPKSECEVLGFEGERIDDEMDLTDVSSYFVTSHNSMSQNNSVLLHVCTANQKGLSEKMSSSSQRVGKGLKLETESKRAKSSKHDPCAYEQKHEYQQAELQTKSFSRLRHRSLDSISGLYPPKASAIFPMFPAECQSNMPNALGWPFGISSCQSSRVGRIPYDNQQGKKSIDKHAEGGNVPSLPPLPPAPIESWLGNIVTKNSSKKSTLKGEESINEFRCREELGRCGEGELGASRALEVSEELQILMRNDKCEFGKGFYSFQTL